MPFFIFKAIAGGWAPSEQRIQSKRSRHEIQEAGAVMLEETSVNDGGAPVPSLSRKEDV